MSIRERPSKKYGKTYQVYFNYTDRYGRHATYRKGGFTKKRDARNHETFMKGKLLSGQLIKPDYTFDDIFNKYIENIDVKPHTKQIYIRNYRSHLSDLKNIKIDVIDNRLLQRVFDSMELSHNSKALCLAVVKGVFKYAYKNNYIVSPVTVSVNIGKSKKKAETFSMEEFSQVISYIESSNLHNKEAYVMALWIGYYTGMRIGEIFALEKSDIDLTNNTISITKTLCVDVKTQKLYISTPKTEASYNSVPLVKPLRELLSDYMESHDYDILITTDGNYINPGRLSSFLTSYSKRNGLHFHFHQLRHNMATVLFENDINPKIAQRILRHSNLNTTLEIYTHLDESIVKESMDSVFSSDSAKNLPKLNDDRKP